MKALLIQALAMEARMLRCQVRVAFALACTCLLGFRLEAVAAEATNAALPDTKCLECHSLSDLTKSNALGKVISLFVDEAKFKHSVHRTVGCAGCHSDLSADHPDDNFPAKPVDCASCHETTAATAAHQKATVEYATSVHSLSRQMGARAYSPATCTDCHGKHDMLGVKDPASRVFKLNLPITCAQCHTNAALAQEFRMKFPDVAAQYLDSMHGRALLKLGLIVAPSCNDCHGVHDIKPSSVDSSPVNRKNVAKTCGKCHVTVEQVYNQSIHGQLLARGATNAPVCTTCHTAHQIENPAGNHFKFTSDQKCGQCHEDRLKHYEETYHGKAMQLGKPNVAPEVAACYDCHGHHDVLPASNPLSRLSKQNIVATCARCHPGATPAFAQYVPHASHMDKRNYPQFYWTFFAMTALLLCVFTFFGGHTAFWLFRSAFLYWTDSKKFREAKIQTQKGDEWFTRFTPFERFLHVLVVTSFLLLVITGMPLKFYYTDWAKVLFRFLGGTDVARTLHHFGAIITFVYFGLHVSALVGRTWQSRTQFRNPATGRYSLKQVWAGLFGPDSMIPTWQDGKDFIAHQKWFFGKGTKPQFDRWTYWEKFDYFAVFWGVFAIGVSGLVMWFPLLFTKVLPGWIINIALIVHSDEALLAAGFIFTVHFFNTHFRLEKFPMDTVIFSGRVSKTELLHERKRWYERLLASNRLEDHRIRDEWERWKGIARAFGYLFFGCGILLLLLIVYAMLSRLLR